jgi:hypothetical protein
VTHHHPFYLETNAMLVSHGGKEHILNAETKKTTCMLSYFHKTETESMQPKPAEKKKKTTRSLD